MHRVLLFLARPADDFEEHIKAFGKPTTEVHDMKAGDNLQL
jgi:hypothetical protein